MEERRERRTTGPVLPGLVISALLAGLVMLHDPGATGYRFRHLVDQAGDLTGITHHESSYAFVFTSPGGDPVGWNPCASIHYVVNPTGAPDDWAETVAAGVRDVTEASGFEMTYDGTTDDRSFEGRLVDPSHAPPVLIGWSDETQVPDLAGSTAGIGGSSPARSQGRVRYLTGMVVLDIDAYSRMELAGDRRSEELILAHELGHVLGLDHVDDPSELMNATYVVQDGFGPGDREGLRRLHDLPCD